MIGQRFGRLVVLEKAERRGHDRCWLCRCDCGNEKLIPKSCLKSGGSRSCGCLRKELTRARQINNPHKKHGDAVVFGPDRKRLKLYITWTGIKYRCQNPNTANYKWYGGKGVALCDSWHDYRNFREWALSHGYREGLTIDRIDSDGNYAPENCRFITQSENTRRANLRVASERMEAHCD